MLESNPNLSMEPLTIVKSMILNRFEMSLSVKFFDVSRNILWILLLIAGIIGLQQVRQDRIFAEQGEELIRQANSQAQKTASQVQLLANIPSLGFRNLVADWTFLQFLQYFGNKEHRQITGYGLSGDFFEIIIDRDPYAYDPYIFLSSSLTLFAAQPERAVELQEKGLQSLTPKLPPESYFIWRSKGIDEILFLDDTEAARRSHEIAAQWAAQSPDPRAEEDQQSLKRTAEFLATDPDNPQVQVNAWLQVLASAPDEAAQTIAIQNIEAIGYEVVPRASGGYSVQPRNSIEE